MNKIKIAVGAVISFLAGLPAMASDLMDATTSNTFNTGFTNIKDTILARITDNWPVIAVGVASIIALFFLIKLSKRIFGR